MMGYKVFLFLFLISFTEALLATKESPKNQEQGWRWRKQLNFRYRDWGFSGNRTKAIKIAGPSSNKNSTAYADVDDIHNRMAMQEARITRLLRSSGKQAEEGDERNKDRNILMVKFSFLVESWHDSSSPSNVLLLGPFPLTPTQEAHGAKELVFRSGCYTGDAVFDGQLFRHGIYEVFPTDSSAFLENDRIRKDSVINDTLRKLREMHKELNRQGNLGKEKEGLKELIGELEKHQQISKSFKDYLDELIREAKLRLEYGKELTKLMLEYGEELTGEDLSQYKEIFKEVSDAEKSSKIPNRELGKRLLHSEQSMLKVLNNTERDFFKLSGKNFTRKSETKKMAEVFIEDMLARSEVEKRLYPIKPESPNPPAWKTDGKQKAYQSEEKLYKNKLVEYRQQMENLKKRKNGAFGKVVGIIMHLHSRFDICEDCAIALFLECKMGYYSGREEHKGLRSECLIGRIKSQVAQWCERRVSEAYNEAVPEFSELENNRSNKQEADLFFVILASSREQLKSSNRRNEHGHDRAFDSIVDIDRLGPFSIQKALDPFLVEDESSEAQGGDSNLLNVPSYR